MAPQVGFEPTTLRLTAECSTVELLRSVRRGRRNYYNKPRPVLSIFFSLAKKQTFAPPGCCGIVGVSEATLQENHMDEMTVKIVAGVLALVLLGVIVLRRKGKGGDKASDDF